MRKIIVAFVITLHVYNISAQNLIINPGAQSLPRGTGWTIISAGPSTCAPSPTNTYLNWTMIPDGDPLLYPWDHTIGAAGGITFFSGCSGAASGPHELRQDIDISGDAADIDLGKILYTFSGYIQTPVNNVPGGQTDQGRFIIDFLDGANSILGPSYTSAWQSRAAGSGTGWNNYINTRLAPIGARKVRIRMQTQVFANLPAINAYFDDLSLIKAFVLPVTLLSFSGNEKDRIVYLNWKVADELNLSKYEVEQSTDGVNFARIAAFSSGQKDYSFAGRLTPNNATQYYYRLKMVDLDGKFSYSSIIGIKIKAVRQIVVSPNPANGLVTVSGLEQPGKITLINSNGATLLHTNTSGATLKINVSGLADGLYILRFTDGKNLQFQKLVIQNN